MKPKILTGGEWLPMACLHADKLVKDLEREEIGWKENPVDGQSAGLRRLDRVLRAARNTLESLERLREIKIP